MLPGKSVFKTTLDNRRVLEQCKPVLVIFTANKVGWCGAVEGAAQVEGGRP